MTKKCNNYKEIPIPHLGLKVIVKDMKYLMGIPKLGCAYTLQAEDNNIYIFFEDAENSLKDSNNYPIVAHEITHVLQMICKCRRMDFTEEIEHMGYIMLYLMEEILDTKKRLSVQ